MTPDHNRQLREWAEREAQAAEERAAEAENLARIWRQAAEGLRRLIAELTP
jgi:hypothetical protein